MRDHEDDAMQGCEIHAGLRKALRRSAMDRRTANSTSQMKAEAYSQGDYIPNSVLLVGEENRIINVERFRVSKREPNKWRKP